VGESASPVTPGFDRIDNLTRCDASATAGALMLAVAPDENEIYREDGGTGSREGGGLAAVPTWTLVASRKTPGAFFEKI